MDKLLDEFRFNTEMHGKVVEHLIAKKVPLNQANLFYQPETWLILSEQIKMGNYHFSPLIEGYVCKRNGNPLTYEQAYKRNFDDVRKIYMMIPMDRAVAHMIYLIYYREFIGMSHDRCVSYKSKIGTSKVAKELSKEMNKKKFFEGYKMDIHHYFDDVNMKTIENQLIAMQTGSVLDSLLWELYHDDRVMINGELIHKHRGLIQGCAFACLLANLILKDIDDKVSKMNVIYYRYSDDIIILGNELTVKQAKYQIEKLLKPKGLQLHPSKVQPINAEEWFEFLGFSFKRDMISVSKKTLKNIEHEIKIRTVSKTRKAHRPATKKELQKMIKDLQWYFFTAFAKSQENFGMGVYLFGTVNVMHDLQAIEDYCKDCLRAAATNKSIISGIGYVKRNHYVIDCYCTGQNCRENRIKTKEGEDDDLLKECGWISLMKMFNDYHTNRYLFENSIFQMANGNLKYT